MVLTRRYVEMILYVDGVVLEVLGRDYLRERVQSEHTGQGQFKLGTHTLDAVFLVSPVDIVHNLKQTKPNIHCNRSSDIKEQNNRHMTMQIVKLLLQYNDNQIRHTANLFLPKAFIR